MGEASHRTPFLWRYPKKFEPRKGYKKLNFFSAINYFLHQALFKNPFQESSTSQRFKFPLSTSTPPLPTWSTTTWAATKHQTAEASYHTLKQAKQAKKWKRNLFWHMLTLPESNRIWKMPPFEKKTWNTFLDQKNCTISNSIQRKTTMFSTNHGTLKTTKTE